MNKISISELEALFQLLIQKLKFDNIEEIHFDMDEYWIVLADEWNNFEKEPSLSVNSLNDDVVYLKKAIEEKQMSSYSDLDRLATILRYISERHAPSV